MMASFNEKHFDEASGVTKCGFVYRLERLLIKFFRLTADYEEMKQHGLPPANELYYINTLSH